MSESPSRPEDEDQVRVALDEVDSIVNNLVKENNFAGALEVAMRGLEIRKNFFGVGSMDFERARVDVAKMVLGCADSHQIHKQFKEATELLAHVDKLTVHPLPRFVALNRGRLLIRVSMLREMLIARHHQGRHRSALTFGRHLLELVKSMHLLYQIPSVYLSLASVYSAMKLHSDALAHCYVAYQHTCRILSALEEGNDYVLKALEMEVPDKAMEFQRGYELFEETIALSDGVVPIEHVSELDLSLPRFNVEVDEDEEKNLTGLQYLLWASTTTKRRDSAFPCVKMASEVQREELRATKPPTTDQASKSNMSQAHKRWGGMLALVFRSIAVEQEHLNQLSSALLTYKVGYTTAVQCLGEEHPVTQQCKAAHADAESSAQQKELQKSYLRKKLDSSIGASRRTQTPEPSFKKRSTLVSRERQPPRPHSQMASTMPLKPRKERPMWNEWFNSTTGPPSRQQPHRLKPMTAPSKTFNTTLNSTLGTLPSTILNPESMLYPEDHHENSFGATSPTRASISAGGTGPLPRSSTSHSHGRSMSPEGGSVHRTRRPVYTSHEKYRNSQMNSSHRPHRHLVENNETVEPIDAADYAYLQQTFGLKHDPAFRQAKPKAANHRPARQEEVESQALAAEKKLAKALAVEMGVNTEGGYDD